MTLVIAHRGASRVAPENTVVAFERAVAMGADAIELDVRRTLDERLVVHHDPHLVDGRTIRDTRARDLPAAVCGLGAALDSCRGVSVNIEIKNDPTEPDHDPSDWVARRLSVELAARGGGRRWLLSSFRLETVDRVRRLLPGARTAWLVDEMDGAAIETAADRGHDAIHPWVGALDPAGVRAAHRRGLAVNTWTCDDPARIAELISWGVDGVCTNVPDVALEVRASATRR